MFFYCLTSKICLSELYHQYSFWFCELKNLKYNIATNLVIIHLVPPKIHCEAMRLLLFQLPTTVVSYVNHTARCLITNLTDFTGFLIKYEKINNK